jgi:hypothetical protein
MMARQRSGVTAIKQGQGVCYRDCYPNLCGRVRKVAVICGERVQTVLQNEVVSGGERLSGALIPALQNRVHQFNSGRGLDSPHQRLTPDS